MASASIMSVLNRLGDEAVKEVALLRRVDKDIRLLYDKLEWLQTFIQHADQERRKGANNYIVLQVRQTREVAYEVEDVLDEFLRKADLDRLAGGRYTWRWWLTLASTCTTQISVRHDLKNKIDDIKVRLKELSDNVDKYLVEKQMSSSSSPNYSIRTAASWDEETKVFGFNEEQKTLEKHLLSGSEKRSVISIVGESGIGKSTLGWKVYDSISVRKKFEVRAWINVPPQINDSDILYYIYRRLCPEDETDKEEGNKEEKNPTCPEVEKEGILRTGVHSALKRLCLEVDKKVENITQGVPKEENAAEGVHHALLKYLCNKRYLIMVDGLANFINWNSILQSLPDSKNGSRVVIITRLEDKEAAYLANLKVDPVNINNLKKEEAKSLFCHRLGPDIKFHDMVLRVDGSQPGEKQEEKNYPEIIHDITGGLPLAIVLLAGLLRTKPIGKWSSVFEQLRTSEEPKKLKRILALCFDDLPSRLKSCFLYFAGMPENLIFNARRIVRLWAAEKFLKPKKGKTMEDVGQRYLKELIARGMIQLVKKDLNGGVWLVAIHNRLHAFAQLEAQEASFLDVHDNVDVLAPASIRRLYLQNFMQPYNPMNTHFPKLRSILCDFAEERSQSSGPKKLEAPRRRHVNSNDLRHHALHFLSASTSKFLRVIDLRGLRIRDVPESIGDMIHVTYLGLRCHSLISLPSSIKRLINLQTLDIKRTEVENVTQEFWDIQTLRHVVANKLRLPNSVARLNNMQTLTGLVCKDPWNKDVSPLDNMVNLRYLEISGLNNQHWDGLEDTFRKLESLMFLHLAGDGIPSKLFTKFILRRLQILELFGRIDTKDDKPEEKYTLPNVTRIVLKESKLDQTFMDKIGDLPSLMALVLAHGSYTGEKLVFSDRGFNHVTSLVMAGLPDLVEWEIRPDSIPSIERIALSGCKKLKIKVECKEEDNELEGLKHLKEVAMWNMPEIKIEPEHSFLKAKINNVTMKTRSDDITSAMQRTGRWIASVTVGEVFQS